MKTQHRQGEYISYYVAACRCNNAGQVWSDFIDIIVHFGAIQNELTRRALRASGKLFFHEESVPFVTSLIVAACVKGMFPGRVGRPGFPRSDILFGEELSLSIASVHRLEYRVTGVSLANQLGGMLRRYSTLSVGSDRVPAEGTLDEVAGAMSHQTQRNKPFICVQLGNLEPLPSLPPLPTRLLHTVVVVVVP